VFPPAAAADLPRARAAAEGDRALATALLAELGARPGNLCFSPTTLRLAGAVAALGARGATADEVRRAFVLPPDDVATAGFAALGAALEAQSTPAPAASADAWEQQRAANDVATIRLAAGMWPHVGTELEPGFVDQARRLGASVQPLDYARDPAGARAVIDQWARAHTAGKVATLLDRDLGRDTALVLASALYIRAQWLEPWSERAVKPAAFFTAAGTLVEVPTIADRDWYRFAEDAAFEAVRFDYAGRSATMTLVLPGPGRSVVDVAGLAVGLGSGRFTTSYLDLAFPRFAIDGDADLRPALIRRGAAALFDPERADLRAIDARGRLFVERLDHRATISVDERGTELAAVASLVMPPAPVPPAPRPLRFDRPFLFILEDGQTGAVLAIGRVDDPAAH